MAMHEVLFVAMVVGAVALLFGGMVGESEDRRMWLLTGIWELAKLALLTGAVHYAYTAVKYLDLLLNAFLQTQ